MRGEVRAAPVKRVGMLGINGMKLSNTELVERLRVAEADATEALINTYGARAHRLALHMPGNEADAEEVVQGRVVECRTQSRMFRGDSALGTWIYRIIANAAYDKLRCRRRRHEVSWDQLPPGQ